jgi:hypothetical protein
MPVGESTENRIAPKSVLRHRPIGDSTPPQPARRNRQKLSDVPTTTLRASRPHTTDAGVDIAEWTCGTATTQTQKRQTSSPSKQPATTTHPTILMRKLRKPAEVAKQWKQMKAHPVLYLGLGMLTMLVLWTTLTNLYDWSTTTLDDLKYGRPRTFQMDAWVGHNEQTGSPSHFIAMNLHSHIEIIEIAGSDPAHTHIYNGPQLYGTNADLSPVTLNFVDMNGDNKLDMIITFQGSRIVFINTGDTFRPMLPSERPQVEQALQHLRL